MHPRDSSIFRSPSRLLRDRLQFIFYSSWSLRPWIVGFPLPFCVGLSSSLSDPIKLSPMWPPAEHPASGHCPHQALHMRSLSLSHEAPRAPVPGTPPHTGLCKVATPGRRTGFGRIPETAATRYTCQKRETRKATLALSHSLNWLPGAFPTLFTKDCVCFLSV